ncbi:STAM-binding protein isoform X1 [Octopus bimaculoides]|uniref:MPN domain-containing protein n=2 Tax=Octopus bimaculoides TaxID=37653 RepID=A0A0L8GQH0_OCTBM|nr:STAM-binding protein isoform X1 [Octopus bimaculoides]|eukprot:XP_014778908.1 PREDICTED: STAM-binding protein-like isoform X1 [Octopus bimaculoides]
MVTLTYYMMFENIHDPHARTRALCEFGSQVTIDKSVAPKQYFRSGLEMLRMAAVYHEEGNLEPAFILYSKFITLFVEKLPAHPLYKSSEAAVVADNKKKLKLVFPIAEKLKKNLTEQYVVEENKRVTAEKKRQAELAEEKRRLEEIKEKQRIEEQAQADKLKQEAEERWLRAQEERYRNDEIQLLKNKDSENVSLGPLVDLGPESHLAEPEELAPFCNSTETGRPSTVKPSVPPRDLKKNLDANSSNASSPSTPPSVDRSTKPSINHLTSIGSTDSSIYGLRTMMVPSQLSEKFLEIARANTAANIETCGILAGKLRQNNFHITHVLVPKQTGTSDTCTTLKEEELFDYIDSHDLITFGWIHTHPSQTAFLSSVDLHTHCSYQIMMPEAIAIVCSPKYNETGIFMLTPERGLPLISSCKEAGFHVHPKEPPLFQTCDHVQLVDDPNVIVADLRNI